MHQKYGIYLPRIDCKILFWRIGEELSLPYFYRKTLVLMSLKLKIDPVVGLLHEKHPANPLISAFVLAIFFLKLNYGLLDRDSCRVNADFKKSGFPCLEELGLLWKRKLSSISTPFSFDPTEFKNFLEFCQKDVIKPLGNKGEISEAELDPIKRLVQSSTWDSSSLAATPEELSPWLLNIIRFDDLGSKIIPPDFWARNFVVVPKINDPIGSDYFQSLLQIGAYFCSSDTESLLAVYERLFTTNVAFETLKALFSS